MTTQFIIEALTEALPAFIFFSIFPLMAAVQGTKKKSKPPVFKI